MDIRIGERMAELRRAKGLSQEEVAERLGVSRQAISKWERDLSQPDLDSLTSMARIYGTSVDKILGMEPSAEKTSRSNKATGADAPAGPNPTPQEIVDEIERRKAERHRRVLVYAGIAAAVLVALLALACMRKQRPDAYLWTVRGTVSSQTEAGFILKVDQDDPDLAQEEPDEIEFELGEPTLICDIEGNQLDSDALAEAETVEVNYESREHDRSDLQGDPIAPNCVTVLAAAR